MHRTLALGRAQHEPERCNRNHAADAAAWHAEVRPGDVLYTPPYHWHHVETGHESSALSVLVPWDPTAEEPAPACMLGIIKPE